MPSLLASVFWGVTSPVGTPAPCEAVSEMADRLRLPVRRVKH
jgi:hypothetical protein